jgi:chorismate synthase
MRFATRCPIVEAMAALVIMDYYLLANARKAL